MKKISWFITLILILTSFFSSCEIVEEETFDESLLLGKWQSGTLYYRYDTGGNGATWDTADDITEAEAQVFTWTLVKDELTHIHVISMGGGVTKIYTVTELTETSLKYYDDFNQTYVFSKAD